jgi:hypothetical protein
MKEDQEAVEGTTPPQPLEDLPAADVVPKEFIKSMRHYNLLFLDNCHEAICIMPFREHACCVPFVQT